MQADQGRGFPAFKLAVDSIPDLLVQLLQAVGLGVDGSTRATLRKLNRA